MKWILRLLLPPSLSSDESLRIIAVGAAHAMWIQGGGLALGFASQLLLARWLGADEYGVYAWAMAWAMVLGRTTGAGMPVTLLRFGPWYRQEHELGLFAGLVRWARRSAMAMGACAAVIGGSIVLVAIDAADPARVSMVLAMVLVPVLALGEVHEGLSRAVALPITALAPRLIARPALVIAGLAILAIIAPLSAVVAMVWTLVAFGVATAWQWLRVRRTVPSDGAKYATAQWRKVAVPVIAVTALQTVVARADVLIIGSALPMTDVAVYEAAARTAMLISAVHVAVNTLAASSFSALYAAGDTRRLGLTARAVTRLIFWPTLAVAAGMLVLAGPLLGLFGEGYAAGRPVLMILGMGHVVSAATGSVGYLLSVTGFQNDTVRILAVSAVVGVGLNLVVVPRFGLVGASVVTTLTTVMWNVLMHRMVRLRLNIRTSILPVR